MTKEENITKLIDEKLSSRQSKEKYLEILTTNMTMNKRKMNKLILFMLFTVISFPLLYESKISNLSIGPLKISDYEYVLRAIPIVFSFLFYQYVAVWFDLADQKITCNSLTSNLFGVQTDSYLNERIKAFSFMDSILSTQIDYEKKNVGCFVSGIWIMVAIASILFPYFFEYYSLKVLHKTYELTTFLDWVFLVTPIFIMLCTIHFVIKGAIRDIKREYK